MPPRSPARPRRNRTGPRAGAEHRRLSVSLALVAAVLVLGAWPLLVGTAVPRWDAANFYAPAHGLVADHARAGQLLLWNPWLNGGRPDGADPQVGALSPYVVAVGLLTGGSRNGFVLYWLLTWWLAGTGVVLLARRLGAPAWGGCLGAVAYATSGFFIGHAQHTSFVHGAAFLPWVIWRLDVAVSRRSTLAAAQAGGLWGLSALAAYPALSMLSAVFAALWAAGRLLFSRGEGASGRTDKTPLRAFGKPMVLGAVFALVGGLVLAPTYVAFFSEGRGYSDRVDPLSRERAVSENALHPLAVATFATPHLALAKLNHQDLFDYTKVSSASIYLCGSVLGLALAALLLRPGDGWRWCLLGLGVLFLLAAMGKALPIRGWLYDLLPPFRYFRHAAILRLYLLFALVVLALLAARDLRAMGWRAWWSRFGAACALLGAAAVGVSLVLWTPHRLGDPGPAVYPMLAAAWGAPVALALFARRSSPPRRWLWPWALVAVTILDGSAALAVSRPVLMAWGPAAMASWEEVDDRHVTALDLPGLGRSYRSPFGRGWNNRNLASKLPVLRGYDPLKNRYLEWWVRDDALVPIATGADRLWFSPLAARMPRTEAAFSRFSRRVRAVGGPVLVVHPRPPGGPEEGRRRLEEIDELPAMSPIAADSVVYRPNLLELTVRVPREGWLLVTDRFSSGWRAWVNGRETTVWPAAFIFRAIELTAGENRVRFEYSPRGYPALLVISWGTLLGIACWTVARERRRPTAVA